MTNIKCRGKATISLEELERIGIPHKNGWVEGFYLDGFYGYICGEVVEASDEYIAPEWWCPVNKATLGFYTTYDDMHGVPIFTNDIIKISIYESDKKRLIASKLRKVRFEDGKFGVNWYNEFNFVGLDEFAKNRTTFQIIGNSVDNPYLIRKENEDATT